MEVSSFPALNACLNTASFIFLVAGYIAIKKNKKKSHKNCMEAALTTSALFLVFYLIYHYYAGSKKFPDLGFIRTIYLSILLTHTVLATLMVPMILKTFYHAYRQQWDKHKKIAKWTFPIWIYVSITGVIIYLMLYQLPKFIS